MKQSALEFLLATQIRQAGLPLPILEYRAIANRQFRWDFAWIEQKLLVEVQGGAFSAGKMGHNSGSGIHRDCEKRFLATLNGWRAIDVAEHHIRRTGEAIKWIKALLETP